MYSHYEERATICHDYYPHKNEDNLTVTLPRKPLLFWLTPQLEENKQKSNIAVLDGVRAIACLIVMSYHICLIGASLRLWNPFNLSNPLFGAIVRAGMSGDALFRTFGISAFHAIC